MIRNIVVAAISLAATSASFGQSTKPLPANAALKPSIMAAADLTWGADLAAALQIAATEKKLVFIDFTGVTCTNCKLNEKTVFTKAEVKEQLAKHVRVQLYTDEVPAEFYTKAPSDEQRELDAEANRKFQKTAFKTQQLPLYVLVRPADAGAFETVAVYDEGRITKADAFVTFLKKPLKEGK